MLGGHLAYRQASGANRAEEVPHVVTEGWHRIGTVDESDGWNVRGPATAPQPAFDTRTTDGHVEIRLRQDDRAEHADNSLETERQPGAAEEV